MVKGKLLTEETTLITLDGAEKKESKKLAFYGMEKLNGWMH